MQRMHKSTIYMRKQTLRNRTIIRLLPTLKQRRPNAWNSVRPLQKAVQHCQQHHPQEPRLDEAKPSANEPIPSAKEEHHVGNERIRKQVMSSEQTSERRPKQCGTRKCHRKRDQMDQAKNSPIAQPIKNKQSNRHKKQDIKSIHRAYSFSFTESLCL